MLSIFTAMANGFQYEFGWPSNFIIISNYISRESYIFSWHVIFVGKGQRGKKIIGRVNVLNTMECINFPGIAKR